MKILLLLLTAFSAGNACGTCKCIGQKLYCTGVAVSEFPSLTTDQREMVSEIQIINTSISVLSGFNEQHFPNVSLLVIHNNKRLDCSLLPHWLGNNTGINVNTDCSNTKPMQLTVQADQSSNDVLERYLILTIVIIIALGKLCLLLKTKYLHLLPKISTKLETRSSYPTHSTQSVHI